MEQKNASKTKEAIVKIKNDIISELGLNLDETKQEIVLDNINKR